MKRIITIFILALFIYNTVGFLAIHPLLSIYYKFLGTQRAEMLSEEDLVEYFVFDKDDILQGKINFRWIHSREFRYNDNMYDVVKKEENDKQLFLYCINDTKEKKLEEEFEKRVHKNSTDDKQRPLANNFNFTSLSEPVQAEQVSNSPAYELIFSCGLTDFYRSCYLDIPSPPPRII